MTEENYRYRTNPLSLRNQFQGDGILKIPVIPKAVFDEETFTDLRFLAFDKIKPEDNRHVDRMVHFFLYDYQFERVWKNPEQDLAKLRRYRAVLSPDFSVYREMNPVIQLYNVFRNRWCGAYFAANGIRVIPTVSWGDENTFDFCFSGIPKGSTVAVSTLTVSAYENHMDQKEFFLRGYEELLRRLEPERILCYHKPFPEMKGNLVYIDYELSSWRHLNETPLPAPSIFAHYICGVQPKPENCAILIKQGYVLDRNETAKGMGSAYGGRWRPKKAGDERFLGEPGEIKQSEDSSGRRRETKIGPDRRAERERHHTDHNRPDKHTDPHDHNITWDPDTGNPTPGPPINYPGGAPEFKAFGGKQMSITVYKSTPEEDRFKTISEFKWCVSSGGEVVFEWKGISYSVTHPEGKINISEGFKPETEKWCNTADDVLEYLVAGDRLRDVITQVQVTERTL